MTPPITNRGAWRGQQPDTVVFLIDHDVTSHFECLPSERQLRVVAVDMQDPNIANRGAGCRAHQSAWLARAAADLDHQFLSFQPPSAARRAWKLWAMTAAKTILSGGPG